MLEPVQNNYRELIRTHTQTSHISPSKLAPFRHSVSFWSRIARIFWVENSACQFPRIAAARINYLRNSRINFSAENIIYFCLARDVSSEALNLNTSVSVS